jgi:hypothetical protein
MLSGIDYSGNDIKYYEGPFTNCAGECDTTPNCVGYITNKDKGSNCWLKSKLKNGSNNSNRDTYYKGGKPILPYNMLSGIDYSGNDIKYYEGPFTNCAGECDATPNCVGYITNKDKGSNCWLKSKLENGSNNSNRDTYYKGEKPILPYKLSANTNYIGNDITYYEGPFTNCAAKCDATPNCAGYVTDKDKGSNCWLKSKLETSSNNSKTDTYFKI